MALISCPECNNEISDTAKKCPHCGYKQKRQKKTIRKIKMPQFLKTPKQKKIFMVVSIIICSVLLGTGGFFGYKYYVVPLSDYKTAESMLKDNKFNDALNKFEKLGDFKSSKTKVLEVHYKEAEYFLKKHEYKTAVSEFEKAQNYEDAVERVRKTKYEWAGKAEVDKAIELYEELGDYKDSEDKLYEAKEEKNIYLALYNIRTAYNKCKSDGTMLASDKESITVDSSSQYDYRSIMDIKIIISELGLPDSLYDEMCATNALMGMRTETFDYYEVNWSYHPDNGLDVIFKFKY